MPDPTGSAKNHASHDPRPQTIQAGQRLHHCPVPMPDAGRKKTRQACVACGGKAGATYKNDFILLKIIGFLTRERFGCGVCLCCRSRKPACLSLQKSAKVVGVGRGINARQAADLRK
jgi:hypothetical protein